MEIKEIHNLFLICENISIDTRNISNDSMFFAIKGDHFDANTFAKEALEKGAKYVIIDNPNYYVDNRTIIVNNSLETLQKLANYHRLFLNIPIIGLTGSNGKTTTKELIAAVLSKKYNTKATKGNLNNHIGVPLTLLSFNKATEIGIVEMGANHQKEIEFLCQLAEPNYGYITNFGKAHLEGFGGFEGVIKGKSELYQFLEKNNKKVFINNDDAIQVDKSKNINQISFAISNKADYIFEKITNHQFAALKYETHNIQSNLIGEYNTTNICAAVAIGLHFEIEIEEIKDAIENYIPSNNRSQIIIKNNNKIILDAYNANPSSMKAAIDNFFKIDDQNKLMILGDMFELGSESDFEHQSIINYSQNNTTKRVIFVGNHFSQNKVNYDQTQYFETYNDLEIYLNNNKPTNHTILIKGSRGMALERILDIL